MKNPSTRLLEISTTLDEFIETERVRTGMVRGFKSDLSELILDVNKVLDLLKELYDFTMKNIPAENIGNYTVLTRVEDQLLELGSITRRIL